MRNPADKPHAPPAMRALTAAALGAFAASLAVPVAVAQVQIPTIPPPWR